MRLLTCLAASTLLYAGMMRLSAGNGARDVTVFLATMAALFVVYAVAWRVVQANGSDAGTLPIIFGGALLFRLVLVPAGLPHDVAVGEIPALLATDLSGNAVVYESHLLYDDDIWRYLWEGHVARHGASPYLHAPTAARLDSLAGTEPWIDIRARVNHSHLTTVYPPLAQWVFRGMNLVAPASIVGFKLALIAFELFAIVFMSLSLRALGRSQNEILLYAWNPLAIKVFAGSGHFDAVVVAVLSGLVYFVIRRRKAAAVSTWAAAVLLKVFPIVFLPALVRREGVFAASIAGAMAIAVAVATPGIVFGSASGAAAFSSDWQFNNGFFQVLQYLLSWAPNPALLARSIAAAIVVAAVLISIRRDDGRPESFAAVSLFPLGALLLAGPVLMPWYVTWTLPLALIAGKRFWFGVSAAVNLAVLVMIDGRERPVVLFCEALLIIAFGVKAAMKERDRGAPESSPEITETT